MTDTNAPTVQTLEAGVTAFVRAFGLHQGEVTPCGQPLSVSEAHALLALRQQPGVRQGDLAAALELEKSTVSRLVKHLLDRGWVARDPDERDARAVTLHLTPAGAQLAQRVAAARRHKFERLLDALPEAQRPAVLAALHTLVEALHADQPQPV